MPRAPYAEDESIFDSGLEASSGRQRRCVAAICVLLGVAVFVRAAARLPCISRDGVFFVEFAEQIRADPSGAMAGQTKQPGYSIFLLGLHSLIGQFVSSNGPRSWEICGQIIAVLGGAAVVWLIYLLTRRLFDATTALIAALLAAFWPQLVTLSSDVLSDSPHLALYLAGLLLGLRAIGRDGSADDADHRRWETLAACGSVCGVAYWLRQEALGAMAAVVICLLWPTSVIAWRRRVARAAVVATAFIVVVAPYSIAVGKVMPNKSIKDLLFGKVKQEGQADGADEYRYGMPYLKVQQAGPVVWWDAPIKMAAGWGKSGRYVLSTLALVGFFWRRMPKSDPTVKRLVMIAALLQILAAQARGMQYGIISDRYLLILAGLSIPWSASGLWAISRFVGERYLQGREAIGRSDVARRSLTVAALIAIAPMAYYDLVPAPSGARWEREAGAWIAEHATKGDVVVAAHQRSPVSFYAGLERQWPVGEGIDRALSRASAAWVVDDPTMNRMTGDEKALLAECRERMSELEPSRIWEADGERPVKVYRIGRSK